MSETLTIARLGSQGDGVADTARGPVFVPFALPGETVVGGSREIRSPASTRVTPICRYFGTCGGCKLQHLESSAYLAWKHALVADAFRARGLEPEIAPVMTFPDERRRRAVFAATRVGRDIRFGFHAPASHDIVDLAACPVVEPVIERALPGLRTLVRGLLPAKREARVAVLASQSGLDVSIDGVTLPKAPAVLAELALAAASLGLARLTVAGELVAQTVVPAIRFGKAEVTPVPGAFLQAVSAAERAMASLVVASIAKAKQAADLFCGLGALTFPLAERCRVLAVDGDPSAIAGLASAARRTAGIKPVQTKVRDLFRDPLSPTELQQFDVVVFDPPRAGAAAQCASLARSRVPQVIAVSCDMGTLARDARTLIDGGYALERVTPLDQFRYTPHVEAVAVLRR